MCACVRRRQWEAVGVLGSNPTKQLLKISNLPFANDFLSLFLSQIDRIEKKNPTYVCLFGRMCVCICVYICVYIYMHLRGNGRACQYVRVRIRHEPGCNKKGKRKRVARLRNVPLPFISRPGPPRTKHEENRGCPHTRHPHLRARGLT
jgi:hypothetical protein